MVFGMGSGPGEYLGRPFPQVGSSGVIDRGASLGLLVVPGEPFSSESGTAISLALTQDQPTMKIKPRKSVTSSPRQILKAADSSPRSFLDAHILIIGF
jgi:hypothetical protein